ncbi:MAG TPA: putative toxin-antitoxin system toxin component, PIN family [bacterium]
MTRRVLPDVQALVQAAISARGAAAVIISSWERDDTRLITCEAIVAEYEGVMRRSHILREYAHITNETITATGTALRERSVFVTVSEVPRVVTEDPDDDIVLACAVAGNADYIVTRDQHLLALGTHRGIPIVSAEALAAILRGQVSEPVEFTYGGDSWETQRALRESASQIKRGEVSSLDELRAIYKRK